jgi:hypothetical protein
VNVVTKKYIIYLNVGTGGATRRALSLLPLLLDDDDDESDAARFFPRGAGLADSSLGTYT